MQPQHIEESLEWPPWEEGPGTQAPCIPATPGDIAQMSRIRTLFLLWLFQTPAARCSLMGCTFGQVCTWESCACKQPIAKITIPVVVGGLPALVDSGCGQTLVRQQLAPPVDPSLRLICLQCIYSDMKLYPSVRVPLTMSRVT